MTTNWKEIWERKGETIPDSLEEAIKANGFGIGSGQLDREDFQRLVEGIRRELRITPQSRVLEVGCGCGVILKELAPGEAVGVDYSSSLIRAARQLYPQAAFQQAEANAFEADPDRFDAVFSHGIFMYLPDHDYVGEMITRMVSALRKQGRGLLMDIPDAATRDECEAHRAASIPGYADHYASTPHSYWQREMILQTLTNLGCSARPIGHFTRDYGYSRFRFNILFEKH